MSDESVRPQGASRVDHVVMPVVSLDASRDFFEGLGFLVAPEAVHPFGTKNACVFFASGPYIEPLAIENAELCEREARSGNVFVGRDAAYRFRRGVPGFSALVFGSGDAAADLDGFQRAGLAEGPLFQFSRAFTAPDGESRELSFRLAFAADRRAPDIGFFVCEMIGQGADRSTLTRHPNGATSIRRMVLSEPNPADFAELLTMLVGGDAALEMASGVEVATDVGVIDMLTPTALAADYGGRRHGARGPLIEGLVVAVPDFEPLRKIAGDHGMSLETHGDRLVARLGGQTTAFLAFEEERL